jgi:anti-sigma regulatory factor (Ser/Thr protein kinase)
MSEQVTVLFKNQLAEIERLEQVLNDFAQRQQWAPQFLFEVNVALEELLTNVISYAYDDDKEHEIILRLLFTDGEMTAELEDDGRPFNPLDRPEPDTSLPVEDRPIGGLGIYLARKFMSDVAYHREQDRNRLVLKKKSGKEEH